MVEAGSLALPEFQRDFVWEPNAIIELLESVANGWPIGTLLILEGPQPFEVRAINGATLPDKNEVAFYLLDGQQRVTSIYQALTGSGDLSFFFDFDRLDDGFPTLSWEKKSQPKRGPHSLSVVDYLTEDTFPRAVSGWQSRQRRLAVNVREEVVGAFIRQDYEVPAIIMAEDIELEALTRIFETLNRTGVRLNAFDLVVASQYSKDFSLRSSWNDLKDALPALSDFEIDGIEPLKLLALQYAHGQVGRDHPTSDRKPVTGIRQRDVLNLPRAVVRSEWELTVRSYAEALELMRERFGVSDAASIPSSALILSLAYWISRGDDRGEIERWYWRAIATQRYAQGANTQVVSDTREARLPEISSERVSRALREYLTDSPRRNKMLRMGLRGLALVEGLIDPRTGEALTGPVRDIDFRALGTGEPGDNALWASIWANESSLRKLRTEARKVGLSDRAVAAEARFSQNFSLDSVAAQQTDRTEWLINKVMVRA